MLPTFTLIKEFLFIIFFKKKLLWIIFLNTLPILSRGVSTSVLPMSV